MAQYKVPQNVEADDKLIGPFSFRQFVYLLIAGGGIALAVVLFQVFPLLAIIPLPIILFFLILALPLKKDQPMETYLAAIVSFYTKPRKRLWTAGQQESTIRITTPKKIEETRIRDISQAEAGNRLSFLTNVIDSGGEIIQNTTAIRPEIYDEANTAQDMLNTNTSQPIDQKLNQSTLDNHAAAVQKMENAIKEVESSRNPTPTQSTIPTPQPTKTSLPVTSPQAKVQPKLQPQPKPPLVELSRSDYKVSTIAKEAHRRQEKKPGEVYVSLH